MQRRTCKGTNAQGEPCKSPVVGPDGWCPAHGPNATEHMSAVGRKGAAATARKLRGGGIDPDDLPPLDSPQAAERWCEVIGRAVATDRISHNAGRTLAQLVREWLRSHEAGAVTDRVDELQKKVAKLKRGGLEAA